MKAGVYGHTTLAALLALGLLLPSCSSGSGGGGGGGGTTVTGNTSPPPPTTTLPPQPAAAPTIQLNVPGGDRGVSPVSVRFDLCASRDGSGGTNLTYLADFEGRGLETQSACSFEHTYRSDGVTRWDANLCVRNVSGGQQTCVTRLIKSWLGVNVQVSPGGGCAGTITATATLASGSGFTGSGVMGTVDQVEFRAFNAAGAQIARMNGQPMGPTQWTTGTWNVNNTAKVRVTATTFAGGVSGDDDDGERPACGS